jgi:hypothetical protein
MYWSTVRCLGAFARHQSGVDGSNAIALVFDPSDLLVAVFFFYRVIYPYQTDGFSM